MMLHIVYRCKESIGCTLQNLAEVVGHPGTFRFLFFEHYSFRPYFSVGMGDIA